MGAAAERAVCQPGEKTDPRKAKGAPCGESGAWDRHRLSGEVTAESDLCCSSARGATEAAAGLTPLGM